WNLRISYSLSVPRKYYYNEFNALDSVSNNVIQTMGINGSFSLTKNWNITFRTGWDFTKQAISYTSIDVYRNLHCWQMTFNWVPIGTRQRWDFTIRVKADMLKDLKLDLRSGNQYLM
ncbi:MAG TPA: LPS-assembly protein LptD, partial [Bacteroidales bacterium]|nr:LPS-assembly protein LptD [Bacteroidales bacterium]